MELMKQFVNEYGTAILYTVITAIAGYLGVWAKKLYGKYISDKTKKAVAKTVVMAIEQLYRDLNGEEKLEKALESASDMLEEKGEGYLTDLGVWFEMVAPKRNMTKLTHDGFVAITKWKGRTNEHKRDAAMLVFGR